MAAYALQDDGLDTVDANRHLGFEDDLRSYEAVEYILADMGIKVGTHVVSLGEVEKVCAPKIEVPERTLCSFL